MKKVLFISSWGLGNQIQTSPTLQAIHDLGFSIDIYANPVFPDQYDLFEGWEIINHIYIHQKEKTPDFAAYDYLVYHHPARYERWSRYKEVMSNPKKFPKVIQNGLADPFWPGEIGANLELAIKLGWNFQQEEPKIHIEYDKAVRFEYEIDNKAKRWEKEIVLSPTTHSNTNLWGPKYWHYWPEFMRLITKKHPSWRFWVIGCPGDSNTTKIKDIKPLPPNLVAIQNVAQQSVEVRNGRIIHPSDKILAEKIGIYFVAGLIKRADLFIGNETGLSWVAEAVDTKALTLWTCTSMRKNWPQNHSEMKNERIVVFKKVCPLQPCHNSHVIPGLWCPYIREGQKHPCGYSFEISQIYALLLKMAD